MSAGEYIVAGPLAVRADRLYRPGEPVELDEADAKLLLESGAVRKPGPPEPPEGAEKDAAIRAAIGRLDRADESKWTKAGEPTTDALEGQLGFKVSAAERDAAWAALEAERE